VTPQAYRAANPRLYGALIARHGGPNAIQLAVASRLASGQDLLLCAPTASGKTEALLVPLAEAHLAQGLPGRPSLLWVCPTRALVNDLARRLRDPLAQVGTTVGRWTGDAHDGGQLQPLTILTPEALDARLSRSPDALDGVGALVLDELHMLDGGPRGDQLRLLVHGLRGRLSVAGRPLQVAAASATVPDPAGLAARYLVAGQVVQAEQKRRLAARIVLDRDPGAVLDHLLGLVGEGFRKILLFCDSREQVEQLSAFMLGQPPFGAQVYAHHGSLARALRLRVEASFRQAPLACCVATSTMEVGLDIGDVDLVGLMGPPPDVSALVQRVGRGGRRGDRSLALVMVEGPIEERIARVLLQAAARGDFLADKPAFHPSVLLQQAVMLAGGRRGLVDAAALHRRLPAELARDWPPERLIELLGHACEKELLLRVGEGPRCVLGPKGEQVWKRGQAHANISGATMTTVVDRLTGDAVGEVAQGAGGDVGLGGRGRRAVLNDSGRVVTDAGGGGAPALGSFGGGSGPRKSGALARAILDDLEIPLPCRARLNGGETLFHGLGSAAGWLLAAALKDRKRKVVRAGPLAIVMHAAPFADLSEAEARDAWPGPSRVELALIDRHPGLARRLQLGPMHPYLPIDEQRRSVADHCQAAAVEAFLARGLPPLVEPADFELWDAAAWT